ncbi:MAG: cupin domain-containing protein [Acetobacteraceae bacterium]|nr:cupin domain-containing protein [Acetobacteraceae bacterium]
MVEAGLKQRFVVSHLREEDFQKGGLRDYARYRDLGIAEATNGMVRAHVIRFLPPCTDEVRKRHYHNVAFQMVYVLKGWIKNEFEGQGEHLMREGSAWIQPPGIRHTVLDYSADCEVLEIILPAEFETVEVASPATQTP